MDSPPSRAGLTRRALLVGLPIGLGAAYAGYVAIRERTLPPYRAPATRRPPPPVGDELRLLVVGDWGSATRPQARVARAMEATAAEVGGVHAGLFLGDNFYNDGVADVDDPQFRATFEEVYDTEHLGLLTWHAVLGNHDYDGNTQAQIAYTARSGGRWHMPDEYYRVDLPSSDAPLLTILALDTNRQFAAWDDQLVWLEDQLSALADAPQAVIALGHHPLISYCRKRGRVEAQSYKRLWPLLADQDTLDLYLSGHAHNLEMIETGAFRQALIGGGGKRLHPAGTGPGSLFGRSTFGFGLLRVRGDRLALELYDDQGDRLHVWERVLHATGKGRERG